MATPPKRINRNEPITANWLNTLLEFAKGNVLSGSSSILVNRVPGRTTVSVKGGGVRKRSVAEEFEYEGYFAVTELTPTSVRMLAGEALINNNSFTIATEDNTITQDSYLYLSAEYTPPTYDEFGEIITEGVFEQPTVELAASVPADDSSFIYVAIAYMTFANSVINDIVQHQHGTVIATISDDGGGASGVEFTPFNVIKTYPHYGSSTGEGSAGALGDGTGGSGTTTPPSIKTPWDPEDDPDDDPGDSTEALPARRAEIPITDTGVQLSMDDVCGDGSCDGARECISAGRPFYVAGTFDSVTNRIALYEGASFLDTKCEEYSSAYYGSCGSVVQIIETTSDDGVLWYAAAAVCCCKKDATDTISELTLCSDNTAACPASSDGCEALAQAQSINYGSYTSCVKAQLGLTSQEGMDFACEVANIEGDVVMPVACGYTDLTACVQVSGLWRFTYTACCCTLEECPVGGGLLGPTLNQQTGGSLTARLTNSTTCTGLTGNVYGIAQNGTVVVTGKCTASYPFSDCGTTQGGVNCSLDPGEWVQVTSTNISGPPSCSAGGTPGIDIVVNATSYDARLDLVFS